MKPVTTLITALTLYFAYGCTSGAYTRVSVADDLYYNPDNAPAEVQRTGTYARAGNRQGSAPSGQLAALLNSPSAPLASSEDTVDLSTYYPGYFEDVLKGSTRNLNEVQQKSTGLSSERSSYDGNVYLNIGLGWDGFWDPYWSPFAPTYWGSNWYWRNRYWNRWWAWDSPYYWGWGPNYWYPGWGWDYPYWSGGWWGPGYWPQYYEPRYNRNNTVYWQRRGPGNMVGTPNRVSGSVYGGGRPGTSYRNQIDRINSTQSVPSTTTRPNRNNVPNRNYRPSYDQNTTRGNNPNVYVRPSTPSYSPPSVGGSTGGGRYGGGGTSTSGGRRR